MDGRNAFSDDNIVISSISSLGVPVRNEVFRMSSNLNTLIYPPVIFLSPFDVHGDVYIKVILIPVGKDVSINLACTS